MSAKAHLERVRSLRCVVCTTMNVAQSTPTAAHHIESVRDGLSDYAVAALCHEHHQGPNGVHGLSRRGFEMRYRLTDIDLIALTIRQLDREGVIA
jgi:hypothetical protein